VSAPIIIESGYFFAMERAFWSARNLARTCGVLYIVMSSS